MSNFVDPIDQVKIQANLDTPFPLDTPPSSRNKAEVEKELEERCLDFFRKLLGIKEGTTVLVDQLLYCIERYTEQASNRGRNDIVNISSRLWFMILDLHYMKDVSLLFPELTMFVEPIRKVLGIKAES